MKTCLTCIHARQLKRSVAASGLCAFFDQTVLLNWKCSEHAPLTGAKIGCRGAAGASDARSEARTESAHGEAANYAFFEFPQTVEKTISGAVAPLISLV